MEFDTIEYLKHGNTKQRQVYQLLTKHGIMSSLSVFEPILVGTIPINIDTDCSDIDIICYTSDLKQFSETLRKLFQGKDSFRLSEYQGKDTNAVVGSFKVESFEIEVFGQDTPTRQQLAYRHMLIEHRLLKQNGEGFRQQIIALKRKGFKTEPAFALLLDLKGDPYAELLNYETDIANKRPKR
ncbi:DUF4269 domain-containing protein [Pedobacter sp. SYSU D00535]|uniref:DUF4269 domain-containing protein n=1 Tax=Pedobacter sp. SYSU D00535 TaxID=2810308 RepID=UPI001A96AE7A|nr:DUF4269 domain-containing protein [Pedobacter sp. SYSU D00535]